jgi:hypothetical protein
MRHNKSLAKKSGILHYGLKPTRKWRESAKGKMCPAQKPAKITSGFICCLARAGRVVGFGRGALLDESFKTLSGA